MNWQPIETAPKDGTELRLAHEMDPSSWKVETICPTTGAFEAGRWQMNSLFVCRDMTLRDTPTHWMPLSESGK